MSEYQDDDYQSYISYQDDAQDRAKLVFLGAVGALIVAGLIYWAFNRANGMTNEEYMQIQDGMTYSQVVAIAGEEPAGMSNTTIMDMQIDGYTWKGEGPLGITQVSFLNGRVVEKSVM